MLNCIVPRKVLDNIRSRFGDIFCSISPDFTFCYRCLEVVDSILYLDKSILVHYALDRSNGHSAATGKFTADSLDFVQNLNQTKLNYAAPIPELRTVHNGIFHEYCLVKQETHSPKFLEIDRVRYLHHIAGEVKLIQNPELRREMQDLLRTYGVEEIPSAEGHDPESRIKKWLSDPAKYITPKRVVRKLLTVSKDSVRRTLETMSGIAISPKAKMFWLFLGSHFGVNPPANQRFQFDTVEEALDFACRFHRRRAENMAHLDYMMIPQFFDEQ
jgi:hypothetical protein